MSDKSLSISDMQKEAFGTSTEKGWHDDDDEPVKWAFPARLALIHSEVSEALEDFRDGHAVTEIYYQDPKKPGDSPKPCGVPIELADIAIRIGDMCGQYGIDLEEAVKIKLAYNKTRPVRHGGKVV